MGNMSHSEAFAEPLVCVMSFGSLECRNCWGRRRNLFEQGEKISEFLSLKRAGRCVTIMLRNQEVGSIRELRKRRCLRVPGNPHIDITQRFLVIIEVVVYRLSLFRGELMEGRFEIFEVDHYIFGFADEFVEERHFDFSVCRRSSASADVHFETFTAGASSLPQF
jgi:hypothetical protein